MRVIQLMQFLRFKGLKVFAFPLTAMTRLMKLLKYFLP